MDVATLSPLIVDGLAVAPPTALRAYRKHHAESLRTESSADLSPVPIEPCGLYPAAKTAI